MRRVVAGLLAIVVVMGLTDPLGVHRCAMHDGVTVPPMLGMTGAAHGAAHDAAHHSGAPGRSHQCSCFGACCCAPVVTTVADRLVALPVVPVTVVLATVDPDAAAQRPASPDHVVLPPPLGPPHIRV